MPACVPSSSNSSRTTVATVANGACSANQAGLEIRHSCCLASRERSADCALASGSIHASTRDRMPVDFVPCDVIAQPKKVWDHQGVRNPKCQRGNCPLRGKHLGPVIFRGSLLSRNELRPTRCHPKPKVRYTTRAHGKRLLGKRKEQGSPESLVGRRDSQGPNLD